MKVLSSIFAGMASSCISLLQLLFGTFSWSSPPWVKKAFNFFKTHPWKNFIFLNAILIGGIFVYWSQPLHQADRITAEIIPPGITYNAVKLVPDPLIINFGVQEHGWLSSRSVAPLSEVGKPVRSGIAMTPPIAGEWRWNSDSELQFTPKEDWPAGQLYTVFFNKKLFAESVKMKACQCQFSTHPFEIEIQELSFYQDPADPGLKRILAAVEGNFPIDPVSFERQCRLVFKEVRDGALAFTETPYPLKFSYDKHQRKAFIEAALSSLPAEPRFLDLIIEKGVQAISKTSATQKSLAKKMQLPDAGSFLQITAINAGIIYDKNRQPEQVLTLETTAGINIKDLLSHLNVYLLPRDYPETQFEGVRHDYHWKNPGEVSAEVLSQAMKVELQPLPEEYPNSAIQRFKILVPSSRHLYIQLKKGLPGFGGFHLKNDLAYVLKSPAFPKEIRFIPEGSLLALNGEQKIDIQVRGIPEVRFNICRIPENNVNHLITQTYGHLQNPQFMNHYFGVAEIGRIISEVRPFNAADEGILQYASLDLKEHFTDSERPLGLFILQAESWDSSNRRPTGVADSRLVLMTDMDSLVKNNADGSHDLFVHSITTGLPVPFAEIALIGRNGLPILQAQTDEGGHAVLPSVDDCKNERAPAAYLVRKGIDTSFIPYQRSDRQLNYSRFDVGGARFASKDSLNAFIFTDRDIYRPDECVHCGVIVKKRFAEDAEKGLPVEVVISDPRGLVVLNKKAALPIHGFFTLDYQLPASALTGTYDIKVYIVKDNGQGSLLGFHPIRVEDFLPDQMKMDLAFEPEASGWLAPENLRAKIKLMNLSGVPAANCKVQAKMTFSSRPFSVLQYKDYHFAAADAEAKDLEVSLAEIFTDAMGFAELVLPVDYMENPCHLQLLAEGFEGESGRGIIAAKAAFINSAGCLIGYKEDSHSGCLKKDEPATIHYIAIDTQLHPIDIDHLSIELFERKKIPALVKKPNGSYGYQAQLQDVLISKNSFSIQKEGVAYPLPVSAYGSYVLAITDANGRQLSKYPFSVADENGPLTDSELGLKLDKKEYRPGDTIEIKLTAPFKGSGLITIERDKVYAYKWFSGDSSTAQTIAIPAEFQGSGYVNVAFIRAWDADEIYLNPLSYAIAHFNVRCEGQALQVDVKAPDFVRPGEELPIQFSASKPAKIILFAVDEGILQISDFVSPDPLAYFFRKQALDVKTSQMADLILPKYKGEEYSSAIGGDRRQARLMLQQNPFKRKAEAPVIFWSGVIDAGEETKTITYRLPDYFNGKLRLMAVAATADALGSASCATQVQASFAIMPHAPAFMAPGDSSVVAVAITNCLKELDNGTPAVVRIEVSPALEMKGFAQDEMILSSAAERRIIIPAGEKSTIGFEIKAKERLGEAQIKIAVAQGDNTSERSAAISIRPPAAYRTRLINGYSEELKKTISLERQLYPDYRIVRANASANPLILIEGIHSYLAACPSISTQTLIAKAYARLAKNRQSNCECKEFEKTLQVLRERQTGSGGFSRFPGSAENDEDSLFAIEYMIEAKDESCPLPSDLLANGCRYLENYVQQNAYSLSDASKQAHAIYLLTRTGRVTTNYVANLLCYLTENHGDAWKGHLISSYLASTFQLMQSQKEAERLIALYRMHEPVAADDALYLALLARHFPGHLGIMNRKNLAALVQGVNGERLNISSAAGTVIALFACSKVVPPSDSTKLAIQELSDDHDAVKQISIHNPQAEGYFYQVQQSGFDSSSPEKPIKKGIEITREYLDGKGNKINAIKVGEKIDVHVRVRSLNKSEESSGSYLIADLLPGGFEVVPHSINAAACEHADIREDRILFNCSLDETTSHFNYTLKAVNKGIYCVPPIFAQDLNDERIQAQDIIGKIAVE